MTTTVTLKTHAWPVEVTTTDSYAHENARTTTVAIETVPPNSQRDFYVTNTRTLGFAELPLPAAEPAIPTE